MDSHSHCYHILPFITAAAIAYSIYTTYRLCTKGCCKKSCKNGGRCNTDHRLNEEKIVHSFDIESLGDKNVFCRCWKSKKFPYCDGAHNEHNKSTGDNVGPLIVKKENA